MLYVSRYMIWANVFFFSGLAFLTGVLAYSLGYLGLVLSIFSLLLPRRKYFSLIVLSFFLFGFLYVSLRAQSVSQKLDDNNLPQNIVAEVVSDFRQTQYGYRYTSRLEITGTELYLYTDNKDLLYGDRIVLPVIKKSNFVHQNIAYYANVSADIQKLQPKESAFRIVYQFKNVIRSKISYLFPKKEHAELISGMVYGDQPGYDLRQQMIKSGTLHLAVVSGQNITLITRIIERIFVHFPIGAFVRAGLVTSFISVFAIFVGPEPATLRAVLMGVLVIAIGYIGRLPLRRNILLAAALFLVLIDPTILNSDIGFWLSFLAVAGILYLAPVLESKIKSQIMRETVSAQIMTLPLLLYSFGNLSFNSIISNTLLLPLIPYIMVLGIVTLAVSILSLPLAGVIAIPLRLLLEYARIIILFFGSFGFFTVKIAFFTMIASYIVIFVLLGKHLKGKIIDFNFSLYK